MSNIRELSQDEITAVSGGGVFWDGIKFTLGAVATITICVGIIVAIAKFNPEMFTKIKICIKDTFTVGTIERVGNGLKKVGEAIGNLSEGILG